jgi:hypothetical protein
LRGKKRYKYNKKLQIYLIKRRKKGKEKRRKEGQNERRKKAKKE